MSASVGAAATSSPCSGTSAKLPIRTSDAVIGSRPQSAEQVRQRVYGVDRGDQVVVWQVRFVQIGNGFLGPCQIDRADAGRVRHLHHTRDLGAVPRVGTADDRGVEGGGLLR